MVYHSSSVDDVLNELNTSEEGLKSTDVQKRQEKYGFNKLAEAKKEAIFVKFIRQFNNSMIIILIIAAFISVAVSGFKDWVDAAIILFVVIVNATLGTLQESKAEKAIEDLQKMSSPYSKVKRDGKTMQVPTTELVPGDIVLLDAGDFIPADLRLIETVNMKVEEAALTGESVPVEKSIEPIEKKDVSLGDKKNMAFMGSSVSYGRGTGVVVGIGMSTEMGKIATILTDTEKDQTPLQIKMDQLSKVLSVLTVVLCVIMFAVGALKGGDPLEMFMVAVSLAVAAIPEGLAAVVTIVLAIGVSKMAKRNAIIRKLPAVETLGCAQIICSDKTGTLTQNKMTVVEVSIENENIDISKDAKKFKSNPLSALLTNAMVLCNDAELNGENEVGDPTETALLHIPEKIGLSHKDILKNYPRIAEIPFDSERKLMSTANTMESGKHILFVKGAPDELLKRCTHYMTKDGAEKLTPAIREEILKCNTKMAEKALRVLAGAYKDLNRLPSKFDTDMEKDLVYIGLIGMIDPVRPEVKKAVETCKQAGIQTVMITGDHRDTAIAIAKELKIISSEKEVITGLELDKISEEEFEQTVQNYHVYARVSPEHKVRIVKAWKKLGMITAMTGDGVNDAPALKTSDIGVGMGITGTDVSKSVADMVLADDNFATIVSAVEEGRNIYANIRKSIQFLLSSNACEVISIFIATMGGVEILRPVQLLWVNLVTDCFPALALGVEPGESDIMKQKPRNSREGFFAGDMKFNIIYESIILSVITLGAYYIGDHFYGGPTVGSTMAFATLAIVELFHSFNLRSERKSILQLKKGNKFLSLSFIISLLITMAVIQVPVLAGLFKVTPLNVEQWLIVLGLSFSIIPVVELVKFIRRH